MPNEKTLAILQLLVSETSGHTISSIAKKTLYSDTTVSKHLEWLYAKDFVWTIVNHNAHCIYFITKAGQNFLNLVKP